MRLSACACGAAVRPLDKIVADLRELRERARAAYPLLRDTDLPTGRREEAMVDRWMAGLGLAADIRLLLAPALVELEQGLCGTCASRKAREERKAEDAALERGKEAVHVA